ncbi:hypothetical protein [Dysgonomonas termitidis]|uniref:Uncharacterized protein n=1 Tax=Dysgonomonas termitidis TaxID=1516126 RepID=A0ABV9KRI4_9BACT
MTDDKGFINGVRKRALIPGDQMLTATNPDEFKQHPGYSNQN